MSIDKYHFVKRNVVHDILVEVDPPKEPFKHTVYGMVGGVEHLWVYDNPAQAVADFERWPPAMREDRTHAEQRGATGRKASTGQAEPRARPLHKVQGRSDGLHKPLLGRPRGRLRQSVR